MKPKILIICLSISLLVNAAGVVFFVLFLTTNNKLRALKREHARLLTDDQSAFAQAKLRGDQGDGEPIQRTFISHFDGQKDRFALLPPTLVQAKVNLTLIVYLHGMNSNCMEPFTLPKEKTIASCLRANKPEAVILSPSYRNNCSWGNDAGLADLSQNIHEALAQFPIERIVLMGTSMGGCTALSYATIAPPDIKSKVVGIVSIASAGDLKSLFKETQPLIRQGLIQAIGAAPQTIPERYEKMSFLPHVKQLPSGVRVAVVSCRRDQVAPPHFQADIVKALTAQSVPNKLIELDGGHELPDPRVFVEALEFVLAGKG